VTFTEMAESRLVTSVTRTRRFFHSKYVPAKMSRSPVHWHLHAGQPARLGAAPPPTRANVPSRTSRRKCPVSWAWGLAHGSSGGRATPASSRANVPSAMSDRKMSHPRGIGTRPWDIRQGSPPAPRGHCPIGGVRAKNVPFRGALGLSGGSAKAARMGLAPCASLRAKHTAWRTGAGHLASAPSE
jgi:hypothetical protein